MIIAIGADHRGFAYKELIKKHFAEINWKDVGAHDAERSDYPIFSKAVCETIIDGSANCGILICGSGIGMSIAANRYPSIYAGVVWNPEIARVSKEDDNVNVLVIPSDFVTADLAIDCISAWLESSFKHERYQKRLDMIDDIK